jgi:hypothetical protein
MPRRPIGTLPLNVLLPKGLKEQLLTLAAADGRNLSGYVRVAPLRTSRGQPKRSVPPDAIQRAGGGHGDKAKILPLSLAAARSLARAGRRLSGLVGMLMPWLRTGACHRRKRAIGGSYGSAELDAAFSALPIGRPWQPGTS